VILTLLVAAAALYAFGLGRAGWRGGAPFHPRHAIAFGAGLAALAVALMGPVERLAAERFSWHMAQHLLVTMVAAPLLLLGRPVGLARRASSGPVRGVLLSVLRSRVIEAVTHPVVAWLALAVALWATHFTSLYQRALASEPVHVLEHALYLAASLLFWLPVVATEPTRRRLGYPARLLYLFLAAAAGALLASTLFQSTRLLYPSYAGPGGLADQQTASAVMWIGGGLGFLIAILLVAGAWARHDRRGDRSLLAEQQLPDHGLRAGQRR
jgi:putative membrane protein